MDWGFPSNHSESRLLRLLLLLLVLVMAGAWFSIFVRWRGLISIFSLQPFLECPLLTAQYLLWNSLLEPSGFIRYEVCVNASYFIFFTYSICSSIIHTFFHLRIPPEKLGVLYIRAC